MKITDLTKIKGKIFLIKKYLGIVEELNCKPLTKYEKKKLEGYKTLLEAYLRHENKEYKFLIKKINDAALLASMGIEFGEEGKNLEHIQSKNLTVEEKIEQDRLIQELETITQKAMEEITEIKNSLEKVNNILNEILYDTFIDIEDLKKKYLT